MTVPRISVVVPFYNNVDLLGECLASIAAQTITDLQVIMVDDGSTDGSSAAASAHAADDPRFTLVSVPNGGLARRATTASPRPPASFSRSLTPTMCSRPMPTRRCSACLSGRARTSSPAPSGG